MNRTGLSLSCGHDQSLAQVARDGMTAWCFVCEDTVPVMRRVCTSCGKPVERTFDDDWQHAVTADGVACTAWPVKAVAP
jgi:hypothetical protein